MCKRLIAVLAIVLFAHTSGAEKRAIICKKPAKAPSCYWTHGRLAIYNGGAPNFRLWKIGTHNLLGIFSDAQDMGCTRGSGCPKGYDPETDESPILPPNVQDAFHIADPFDVRLFADFEVCPLERHIEGHMQAACIESAKHLVITK